MIFCMYDALHKRGVVHSSVGSHRWAVGHPQGLPVLRFVDFSNARVSRRLNLPVPDILAAFAVSGSEFFQLVKQEKAAVRRKLGMPPLRE